MSGYPPPNNQQIQGYPTPAPSDGYQSPPPGYPPQQYGQPYGYPDEKGQYPPPQQYYPPPQQGYAPQGQYPPQQYAPPPPPQAYGQYAPPPQGYPPQQSPPPQSGNADYYGTTVEARVGEGSGNPHAQQYAYGGQQGVGGSAGQPGEGERGLGSTLLGGTAGAFIGKKIGLGKIGGAAAGAILANVINKKKK